MKNFYYYQTEIGKITIAEENDKIIAISIENEDTINIENKDIIEIENLIETPLIREAGKQIEEYLSGDRKKFDLPLNPTGTEFQKSVWEILKSIPYGETWSYKQVAELLGNKSASRAVGRANHNNPIAIVIPCHRVIGTNGSMVGYASGVELKSKIWKMEKKVIHGRCEIDNILLPVYLMERDSVKNINT